MKRLVIISLIALVFGSARAQNLVQFSGVVVSSDSLYPIPSTSIMIHNTSRGTISDFYGFYTLVAKEGDTIDFKAIGYTNARFIIPENLEDGRYSLIQVLKRDTILLKQVDIYPWPTKEQFKTAFMNLDLPDNDLIRADKNLDPSKMPTNAVLSDPYLSYQYGLNQQQSRLYYMGQAQQISLLNPLAWAKFIDAWRSGALKDKSKSKNK